MHLALVVFVLWVERLVCGDDLVAVTRNGGTKLAALVRADGSMVVPEFARCAAQVALGPGQLVGLAAGGFEALASPAPGTPAK